MLKTFLSNYLSETKGMAWKGYINEEWMNEEEWLRSRTKFRSPDAFFRHVVLNFKILVWISEQSLGTLSGLQFGVRCDVLQNLAGSSNIYQQTVKTEGRPKEPFTVINANCS